MNTNLMCGAIWVLISIVMLYKESVDCLEITSPLIGHVVNILPLTTALLLPEKLGVVTKGGYPTPTIVHSGDYHPLTTLLYSIVFHVIDIKFLDIQIAQSLALKRISINPRIG